MSSRGRERECIETGRVALHALGALAREESVAMQAHIESCAQCRSELELVRPVIDTFASWPTDVVRPTGSLWERLASRIETDAFIAPSRFETSAYREPEWEEVAPGISCKLLATDPERARVSMLVRLDPGVDYPAHKHAGVEELHLLSGELWIDHRHLVPGEYNRAEPGTADERVWSETGCTCVLITSYLDPLG